MATDILDAAVDADEGDRRARLRARAGSLGVLRAVTAAAVAPADREQIIAATRGIGPVVDSFIADERERP